MVEGRLRPLVEALARAVRERELAGHFGVIVVGLGEDVVKPLLESLDGEHEVYASVIGSSDEEGLTRWARGKGWDESRFGVNTAHAVSVRNLAPVRALKIAFVLQEEERLHSLTDRGYEYLGPREVVEQISMQAEAAAPNEPQRNLWRALGSEKLAQYLPLEAVLDYFLHTTAVEGSDAMGPRRGLTVLGLLPDDELLAGRYASVEGIIRRLATNGDVVQRLQRGDEEDLRRAVEAIEASEVTERERLTKGYRALLQVARGDLSALSKLTLADAERLLSGRGSRQPNGDPKPSNGGEPTDGGDEPGIAEMGTDALERRTFGDLTVATIRLVSEGKTEVATRLVNKALSLLAGHTDSQDLVEGEINVRFAPDERSVELGRIVTTDERFGGAAASKDHSLGAVIREPGRYANEYFDTVRLRLLEDLLQKARDRLLPEFEAEDLLSNYLECRKALLPYRDLLSTSPVACLVALKDALEATRRAISAYERLLGHLSSNFGALKVCSQRGAAQICEEILSLDVVRVRGSDGEAVILSPLNPLVLWKYVEFASLLLDTGQTMPESDREFLESEASDPPEPLLAIYAAGGRGGEAAEFGYSGRIGSLPVYRPVSLEASDIDEDSLEVAARKLAALYPPAIEDLRIMLVDPVSTHRASKAIKRLTMGKGAFRHATLLIARTRSNHADNLLPQDKVLDELFSEGLISVEEEHTSSIEDLRKALERRPVHLLGIAGETRKNVQVIEQEGTRLHPVSLPQKLEADPLMGTVSLVPRSLQPAEEQPRHPFSLYQGLVGELSNNPRSEYSLRSTRQASLQVYAPLLPHCQFFLVTGHLTEGGAQNDALRLMHGGALEGDSVLTAYPARLRRGIDRVLRRLNYQPSEGGIQRLLENLQEVGGEGLFATISDKEPGGFSTSALRGQLGLAVALDWYGAQATDGRRTVLSLDTQLAGRWLRKREDGKRPDLLGFRMGQAGSPQIDVIEVKSYEATPDQGVDGTHPLEQLLSVARTIRDILEHQGNILTDRRREILRLQVFREGLANRSNLDQAWVENLNDLLDGRADKVDVRLILVELDFESNAASEDRLISIGEEASTQVSYIRRVRLREPDIQQHLAGVVERIEKPLLRLETVYADSSLQAARKDEDERAKASPKFSEAQDHDVEKQDPPNQGPRVDVGAPGDSSDVNLNGEPLKIRGLEPSGDEKIEIERTARSIYRALQDRNVRLSPVDPTMADVGPSVVRYKVQLHSGESARNIKGKASDLMRELAAEREPIIDNLPGTNYVYVDLPRLQPKFVRLKPLLDDLRRSDSDCSHRLSCPVGVTPEGQLKCLDLTKLPHMLVAGSTGSGKTMFLYSLVVGLCQLYTPDQVQLLLIDPKETDFVFFENLPHLRSGGVLTDPQEAIEALMDLITNEMQERTETLRGSYSRDVWSYNERRPESALAPIVVLIDEFADLADVMDRRTRDNFDLSLRRLAQRARNVGIHLVLATQRPTTDIVNGNLKNNLPCRVSFRLSSQVDSRTILDRSGAENLLGNGDMLISWSGTLSRLQGFYLPDNDIMEILGLYER